MEKHPNERVDDYKLASFMKLRNSQFTLPKLLVDPVVTTYNPWIPRLLREKCIDGIAMRNEGSSDSDAWDDTVFTVIWDAKQQRVTHSIISYHRINDGDILWNSSIRTAVQGSLDNDIQPLAARTLRFRDMET
uniref:ATP-dependent DNA ligase n=1 Tax=Caenorhabditis tropicalis TaxID=1561998 RepID=A0A1I7TWS2_9PELO